MQRTLSGGPAGGETVDFDGLELLWDCGTKNAKYEVRTYEFDGDPVELAVFVGYVPK